MLYDVAMRRLIVFALIGAIGTTAQATERRCGWLSNPTPANWSLIDRAGEWILGEQGRYQMPDSSWDKLPDLSGSGWVNTNMSYGYGCACMTVRTQRSSMRVLEVVSAKAVPLRQCRRDRRLPRPPG